MEPLKIALLQIAPCDSLSENLKKGMGACRKAREMGADIALFPEMFSNGYRIYGRPVEEWQAEAIPADGEFVGAFGKLAKELNMAIGITLLERYDGDPRNALVLFDRFGRKRQGVDCIQIDLIECFVQNGDVAFVAAGEHLVGRGDFLHLGDDVLVVRGYHLSSVIPVGLVSVVLFGVVGCGDDHPAVAL